MGTDFLANELFLGSGPDGKDASNSEVVDDDGASIEGIESDVVSISFAVELLQFGSLLTGESFDEGVFLEMFFDDVIGMDVLLELGVSELVGGFEDDDGWVSEEGSNLSWGIKNGLDDGGLRARDLGEWVVHMR